MLQTNLSQASEYFNDGLHPSSFQSGKECSLGYNRAFTRSMKMSSKTG
jgi:hypothetical protein